MTWRVAYKTRHRIVYIHVEPTVEAPVLSLVVAHRTEERVDMITLWTVPEDAFEGRERLARFAVPWMAPGDRETAIVGVFRQILAAADHATVRRAVDRLYDLPGR